MYTFRVIVLLTNCIKKIVVSVKGKCKNDTFDY